MLNSMLTFIAEKFKGIANYSVKTGRYETEKGIWYYEIKKNGNIELGYSGFIEINTGAGFLYVPEDLLEIFEINIWSKKCIAQCTGRYIGKNASGGLYCTFGENNHLKKAFIFYMTDARLLVNYDTSVPDDGEYGIDFNILILN